jgi:3-dehydroquinate dehydratase-2
MGVVIRNALLYLCLPPFYYINMKLVIINGPNLNLLGVREKSIYGSESFESYLATLKAKYPDIELTYFQSNIEGELINKLHQEGFSANGIILNAGGYTHTSIALADAISAITSPVMEVHISNIYARESFRHHSYLSSRCKGVICGLGMEGYRLAIEYFLQGQK